MKSSSACKNCLYSYFRKHLKDKLLECRKSSPSCLYGESIHEQDRAFWPVVRNSDWCGSFEGKEV